MLEKFKEIIEKAAPEKRLVRAMGLINAVLENRELDDYQKLDRIKDVTTAYRQVTGKYDVWMLPSIMV